MMNDVFQRRWFGPFSIQPMVAPPRPGRSRGDAGEVYDIGPLDGLRSTSIWAHRMAQIPLVSRPYPTARTFPVRPYFGWAEMSGTSGPRLGQGGITLMQADRDLLVNQISAAVNKVAALEDLIVWSGDHDPDLRIALGLDATRFFTLSNSIAPLFPQVKDVLLRISDPDPEFWVAPSTVEEAAIRQWTTGVNEMHKIYMAHKGLQLTLPPGVPPPPGFTFTSPAPATQIIQVRPPAGAPAPARAPAPTAPQGIATTDLLIGGGLALGLGILISVMVA